MGSKAVLPSESFSWLLSTYEGNTRQNVIKEQFNFPEINILKERGSLYHDLQEHQIH